MSTLVLPVLALVVAILFLAVGFGRLAKKAATTAEALRSLPEKRIS